MEPLSWLAIAGLGFALWRQRRAIAFLNLDIEAVRGKLARIERELAAEEEYDLEEETPSWFKHFRRNDLN